MGTVGWVEFDRFEKLVAGNQNELRFYVDVTVMFLLRFL